MTLARLNERFPGASWEFLKIAEDIAERAESYQEEGHDIEDAISQAIDDGLIYTRDQWEVMAYYCGPKDADFNFTIEQFYTDLMTLFGANE